MNLNPENKKQISQKAEQEVRDFITNQYNFFKKISQKSEQEVRDFIANQYISLVLEVSILPKKHLPKMRLLSEPMNQSF